MDAARHLRALGLRIGELEPGPTGSIADVAGIGVGHATVVRDEPDPPAGRGVARTGVTAIMPRRPRPSAAGRWPRASPSSTARAS
jgi:D-aminopeptidase